MHSSHDYPTTGRRVGVAAVAVALTVSVWAMAMPGVAGARGFVRGDFTVAVEPPTASLADVGASACKLTVDATVTFTGDIVGAADGTTVALIGAACSEVATTPPGTFADTFGFVGEFSGTVDGKAVDATLGYLGVTRAGGAIKAVMTLSNGGHGILKVDATAGQGGTYTGFASTQSWAGLATADISASRGEVMQGITGSTRRTLVGGL